MNKSLELTKNEVKILSYLINNKGNIVKRDSTDGILVEIRLFC